MVAWKKKFIASRNAAFHGDESYNGRKGAKQHRPKSKRVETESTRWFNVIFLGFLSDPFKG